jgi:hypothetical protein
MRKQVLFILSILALLIYPLSLSAQNSFSLSLDVGSAVGDQAVTSLNVSADQIVAVQIFGTGIQNANGLAVRFEYDASQVVYEGFDVGDVLPNAQALPERGTGFVEIGIASFWVVKQLLIAVCWVQFAFAQRLRFRVQRFGWCVQNSVGVDNLRAQLWMCMLSYSFNLLRRTLTAMGG